MLSPLHAIAFGLYKLRNLGILFVFCFDLAGFAYPGWGCYNRRVFTIMCVANVVFVELR